MLHAGDCIGAPISSTYRFPTTFTYGSQYLTGFIVCGSSCLRESETLFSTSFVYPNGSNKRFIPKSKLVLTREHGGVTTSSVELIPEFSRDYYYLSVSEVIILKPVMTRSCSEVKITVSLPAKSSSPFVQTEAMITVVISNKGKVCAVRVIMCDVW